ncbi:MAG: RagB/SusD family nutrient uptake outer membrane protein [Bacteroidota bacterium]
MKNIIKYISVIVGLTLGSCSLDIDHQDVILDEDVLTTVDDANKMMIGAYGSMPTFGPIEISSRIGDDLRLASTNTGGGVQIHTWTINSSTNEASGNWSSRFFPILIVNKLLEGVGNVKASSASEEEKLAQYKAEAHALRGYMHFELLRLFGEYNNLSSEFGVPYVTKSGIETPARLSVIESYNGIEADLLKAYELMPESLDDKTRITKDAVVAMLSRLYLYKQDYTKAIEFSSMSIQNYNLSTIANYNKLWSDEDDTEIIWAYEYLPNENIRLGDMFTSYLNGNIQFHPSYSIVNEVSANENDIRNSVIYNVRADGELVVAKYLGTETNTGLALTKLFRISEQYLIRSEAYARSGELSLSADDYNRLRSNRIEGNVDVVFNSDDIALESILSERRLELAYEGHRWFDLKRFNEGIERLDEDIELIPEYKVLNTDSHKFMYLPIPQDELFANDNMKQNNGY